MTLKIYTFIVFSLLLIGCSASTDSRYGKTAKDSEKEETKLPEDDEEIVKETEITEERIDISSYRETFELTIPPENPLNTETLDLWYNYDVENDPGEGSREIAEQVDGYRVQVLVTDDLEEANQIRSEIHFKTNQKSVYIVFEPPFYKVKTGDFVKISDARELNFKLNQMGYKESKVVTEKVNVYK